MIFIEIDYFINNYYLRNIAMKSIGFKSLKTNFNILI